MFARLFAVASLAALAVAGPAPIAIRSQCDTGAINCCNSVQQANNEGVTALLGLLGIAANEVNGLVGVNCTPLSVIGTGSGAQCTQQPVCCTGNNFNGLVNLGCTPINLGA